MVQTIGQSLSSVQRHMYFALPKTSSLPSGERVRIVPYDPSHEEALSLIASVARGSIYVAAEQLTTDPELTAVDQLYREVGLRRTRRVWRSEEHTSELQSQSNLVCRLLLEKKKKHT